MDEAEPRTVADLPAAVSAKTALVHDWLYVYGGAERVLEKMLDCYPRADLFSLIDFLPPGERGCIRHKPVTTSFIQRLPGARSHHRAYLPLMPLAIEQLDLSPYELVLSSSYAVASGVLTGPDQLHLCMCYSPIRYAWDLQHQYLREAGLERGVRSVLARAILHYMRLWESRTANGVDAYIAISEFIARRIRKVHGRPSKVIYPPVDVAAFALREQKEDFYLTVARMVPYKQIPLVVEAFAAMPNRRLVVIGDGPDLARCKAVAAPNVELLGHQPFEVLRDYLQRARAFIFAAEEDFGIAPVEAQACGTPVVAFGRGGVRETIVGLDEPGSTASAAPTGLFFPEQSVAAVVAAVERFDRVRDELMPADCRANALRFAPERFRAEFSAFVQGSWARHEAGQAIDGWWQLDDRAL